MKKLILITLLLLLYTTIQAQKHQKDSNTIDPNKFTGLGVFKIGIDTNKLLNYINSTVDSFAICISYKKYTEYELVKYPVFIRLKHEGPQSMSGVPFLSYNPDVMEYLLTTCTISGIEMHDIRFKFYKNKLINVNMAGSDDILNAVIAKCGKGKSEGDKFSGECADISNMDENNMQCWSNGPLIAMNNIFVRYYENCKKDISSNFSYSVRCKELDLWEDKKRENDRKALKNATPLEKFNVTFPTHL